MTTFFFGAMIVDLSFLASGDDRSLILNVLRLFMNIIQARDINFFVDIVFAFYE